MKENMETTILGVRFRDWKREWNYYLGFRVKGCKGVEKTMEVQFRMLG